MAEKPDAGTSKEKENNIENHNFFDIFPQDVFGTIPDEVSKMIVDSGFDRLVTFVTLTSEDISELDSQNNKLKFGYRRLLTQMIEFAKKKLMKVESDRDKAENSKYWATTPVNSKKQWNNTAKSSKSSDNNVEMMLKQSIHKTIQRFCKSNKIDSFTIAQLDLVKSTDDKCLAAEIVCLYGKKVKVYTTARKNDNSISWVTSTMLKHLTKFHTPVIDNTTNTNKEMSQKITNFLLLSKSNPVTSPVTIEIIDAVNNTNRDGRIDLENAEVIFDSLTDSENDSGNMS